MAACGRCQGKGTIQPFTVLEPTRCPVCIGSGWAKPPRRSTTPDRPDHTKEGFITIDGNDDPNDVTDILDSLPWGLPPKEHHD